MFLLIPLSLFMQHIHDLSLHSTMFLLILIAVKLLLGLQAFTFHDVSINTDTTQSRKDSVLNFTFHDVSINTLARRVQGVKKEITLHSTMFLLIPVVYLSLQYRYNLTTFCQSCHFIIFILIFIFLDSSHF